MKDFVQVMKALSDPNRVKKTIRHDWIIFNTVDEAMEFFNNRCGEFVGYYA